MNKKADTKVLMIIFELLVVVVVIGGALQTANHYTESDTTKKIIAADELTMMINVLIGVPGEGYVPYQGNLSKYLIILNSEDNSQTAQLTVMVKDENEYTREVRAIHLPAGHTVDGFMENIANVCLEKKHKEISLVECR